MPKGAEAKDMKRLANGHRNFSVWQHGADSSGTEAGEIGQMEAVVRRNHQRAMAARQFIAGVARPPTPKPKGNPKKKNKGKNKK